MWSLCCSVWSSLWMDGSVFYSTFFLCWEIWCFGRSILLNGCFLNPKNSVLFIIAAEQLHRGEKHSLLYGIPYMVSLLDSISLYYNEEIFVMIGTRFWISAFFYACYFSNKNKKKLCSGTLFKTYMKQNLCWWF